MTTLPSSYNLWIYLCIVNIVETLELAPKWVSPAVLVAILEKQGRTVHRGVVTNWMKLGLIPVLEIPVGEGKVWHLVDKTKVPEERSKGRPPKK